MIPIRNGLGFCHSLWKRPLQQHNPDHIVVRPERNLYANMIPIRNGLCVVFRSKRDVSNNTILTKLSFALNQTNTPLGGRSEIDFVLSFTLEETYTTIWSSQMDLVRSFIWKQNYTQRSHTRTRSTISHTNTKQNYTPIRKTTHSPLMIETHRRFAKETYKNRAFFKTKNLPVSLWFENRTIHHYDLGQKWTLSFLCALKETYTTIWSSQMDFVMSLIWKQYYGVALVSRID